RDGAVARCAGHYLPFDNWNAIAIAQDIHPRKSFVPSPSKVKIADMRWDRTIGETLVHFARFLNQREVQI
ncbi:MAG: hypothetical protein AAF404_09730, partial [Pseudomonadota bacterium]